MEAKQQELVVAITCQHTFQMLVMDVRPDRMKEAMSLRLSGQRIVTDLAEITSTLIPSSAAMLVDQNGIGAALTQMLISKGFGVQEFHPGRCCDTTPDADRYLNVQAKGCHLFNSAVTAGLIRLHPGDTSQLVDMELGENGRWRSLHKGGKEKLSSMLGLYWHKRATEQ